MRKRLSFIVLVMGSLIPGFFYIGCGGTSTPTTPGSTSPTISSTPESSTATNTPTVTFTRTKTLTATPSSTKTVTVTSTITATLTVTSTPTVTNTVTATLTVTSTPTTGGASWQVVGTAGFGSEALYTSLHFNNNNPYVVYADESNGDKGMVEEYNGTTWSAVYGADFTPGAASYISAAFYNNNLYVAYADSTESNLVTVEEYTGSAWVTIGNPGFGGSAAYTSIALDSAGKPYVAFEGVNFSYLMEYNGTNWVTVGGGAFSTGGGIFPSVAIDSSNNPYVAFGDSYYGGASLFADISGAVTYLGGFSGAGGTGGTSVANYTSLVFNGGNPYVAYMNPANNDTDNVMEWNGSSWAAVGSAGFTGHNAYYTTLAFSPANNNAYVSYSDETSSPNKATVMEHTGAGASGWVTVGSPDFSSAGTSYNSLAFDTSGNPYVAYSDGNITSGGKVTVMEYH
jgi:hypothetical protein